MNIRQAVFRSEDGSHIVLFPAADTQKIARHGREPLLLFPNQHDFGLELFHDASFLRSGYRAGTQHIVGRIEFEFISWELMLR